MNVKKFDLNIEKILEGWEVYHALREVIANALDEQFLTKTKDIEIVKDSSGKWHIRDFGRGLKYEHLTQKENEEKIENPHVIGKFGIGLKDSLATFERKGVNVIIKTKYDNITLDKSKKHDFNDIITLHANLSPSLDSKFVGTEFILEGAKDEDITKAKNLFLKFSGDKVVEKTESGEVLEKRDTAKIYVNGVNVAEEEKFLFSYNITSINTAIRKALNRERTNVGRTAYSERVKTILLSCKGKEVAGCLIQDLEKYSSGEMHDELKWLDVQVHAVKILNAKERVIFLTSDELISSAKMVNEAQTNGYKIITIPQNLKTRINGLTDINGNLIRDLGQFVKEFNDDFKFKFIDPEDLLLSEKTIFNKTNKIFNLIGGKPSKIKEIKISETMRRELGSFSEAAGLWERLSGRIIIKRDQLQNIEKYSGTLLHEVAHAISDSPDISSRFELELTRLLGLISSNNRSGLR